MTELEIKRPQEGVLTNQKEGCLERIVRAFQSMDAALGGAVLVATDDKAREQISSNLQLSGNNDYVKGVEVNAE